MKRGRLAAVALLGLLSTAVGACGGRSAPSPPAPDPVVSSAGAAPGSFTSLGRICRDGTPAPITARGVTADTIRIGVIADPGSSITPGLEQEYFDVAGAFAKWCNAAGGINGRRLVIDRYDARLFDGAAAVLQACQRDFMLVGNGNALDAADVKPRLGCGLAEIPALSISPEAVRAPLQVQATASSPPGRYAIGPLRVLAERYPAAQRGLAIGSSSLASLSAQGTSLEAAYEALGYPVSVVQQKPALVANLRPYMEQLRLSGAQAYTEIVAQDPGPEVTAMNDVGWRPAFVLWNIQFYDPKSVRAAKAIAFPPSYVALGALPAELVDSYPVLQQIRAIMTASVAHPTYTSFTGLAFSAWTLWAASADACGATLTPACVLAKAARPDWTAGGFFPPHSTVPGHETQSPCFVLMRLTGEGFRYDRAATAPTDGVYNCRPDNVVSVNTR